MTAHSTLDLQTILVIGLFILSALPLHRAVKIVKGLGKKRKPKISFTYTLLVAFVAGVVISVISFYLNLLAGFISFIILLWIYRVSYRLSWTRAGLVWLVHLVFIIISALVLEIILRMIFRISGFFN